MAHLSAPDDVLSATLFGKARRAILSLLYGRADEAFYVREIGRLTGLATGSVLSELKRLLGAGIVVRVKRGHQVYYQANECCPVYSEIKMLIVKTVGLADALRKALEPLACRIRLAYVYGSFASGEARAESDVDLMVVGRVSLFDVVSALRDAQRTLGREISPTAYSRRDYERELALGEGFIHVVHNGPKIMLIGGADGT